MSEKIILTVTNDLVYDQRMHRICASLQKNGYTVELVGRKFMDSKQVLKMPFMQTRLNCFFNKGVAFYLEFNIRLFFYLLLNQFDIVCGCDLDTLPAAVLAAKIKNNKSVYDAHEYFPESPELVGRAFKQNIWYGVEKLFVPRVSAMYTVTDSIARLFHKKYGTDCKVIRNLPVKSTTPVTDAASVSLLYQGAVNVGRGLNEMLLVMLMVNDAVFSIAGDGDEMEHVKHSIKELKLDRKVNLLGKQTPDKLKEITRQAYIGINLLENRGLSYYYSLGNKTFDYIQAGVPQVMIGFPEYIELNKQYNIGLIVDELSVEKIFKAIDRLIKDKELYRQLQQNCISAREELCWEREEQKLKSIYQSLSNRKQ